MSHDGSPSPMYWVIWSVFQNLWRFPVFQVQHGVPVLPVLPVEQFSASEGLGTVSLLVIHMVIQC